MRKQQVEAAPAEFEPSGSPKGNCASFATWTPATRRATRFRDSNVPSQGRDSGNESSIATLSLPSGELVLLDRADSVRVATCRWWAERHSSKGKKYVYARGKVPAEGGGHRTVYLHRFLVDAEPDETVWHASGNGLDNRRQNLMVSSRAQAIEVTDADIEAGELDYEIDERFRAAFKQGA